MTQNGVGELWWNIDMFNWNNFVCQEKVDGSLILIYYWQNQWRINTRGSFGQGEINYSGLTWDELIRPLFDESLLNKQYTYVCEFCSPHNKIVKLYPKPTLYLLTVFNRYDELEFDDYMVEAGRCGFLNPKTYTVSNNGEVDELIDYLSGLDKTNEGVVLRDFDNNRIKVKSSTYLSLHRMANNGDPCHPKNILPFILSGELDELLSYFPEVKDQVAEMEAIIMIEWQKVDNLWFCFHDEPSQKKFALAVKDNPHSGILFSARKLGVEPKDLFYDIDYLVKFFKNREIKVSSNNEN